MSGEAIKAEKTKLNGIEDHYARDSALRYAEGYKDPQKQEDHYARDSALRYAEGYKDPQNASKMMYVAASCLNVRKGAGRKYSRLGALSHGKAVNVLEKKANGWYKISFGAGVGWVKGKYLADKSGSAQVQPAAVDTSERAEIRSENSKPRRNSAKLHPGATAKSHSGATTESHSDVADKSHSGANYDPGKVVVETGRFITKNVVMHKKPEEKSGGVDIRYLLDKNQKYAGSGTLLAGMTVDVLGSQKDANGGVWTKVKHWNKRKLNGKIREPLVGWVKNLDNYSADSASGTIVGDAELKDDGKVGKKGTGLAQTAVNAAKGQTSNCGSNRCQAFVSKATQRAIGYYVYCNSAMDAWRDFACSTDMSNIPMGAAVYFTSPQSSDAGHVGLHMGGGKIAHQLGHVEHESLADVTQKHNYRFRGWGWNGGVKLKQPDEQ